MTSLFVAPNPLKVIRVLLIAVTVTAISAVPLMTAYLIVTGNLRLPASTVVAPPAF